MTHIIYDNTVREKVIKYILDGNSQYSAAKLFNLNTMTVSRWYLRYKNYGSLVKQKPGVKARVNKEELINHINAYPDENLGSLSKKFGISVSGVHYWLQKLGFCYKRTLQISNK